MEVFRKSFTCHYEWKCLGTFAGIFEYMATVIFYTVSFNNKSVEIGDKYKYVGNIIVSTPRCGADIFSNNYRYFCN